ncbi:hypothetical protein OPU71_02530 [Niveibacterium sp. 24ML]|uniref:hypothetical protein n=1 Tax=Niveibacterium sp. 24ML TaxID=2985512 RepID=UPI0022717A43|nr:hypothetical protein [Niveibacterium sp. 24ML]MCX9154997.1 hypothetical protein [Niveibacterium sp. 24ML]
MTQPPSADETAQRMTRLADQIMTLCKSDDQLTLELKIAAIGFAARGLCAYDAIARGGDPKARMHALRDLFNAAFEHGLAETVADVETARAMQRMTGKPCP